MFVCVLMVTVNRCTLNSYSPIFASALSGIIKTSNASLTSTEITIKKKSKLLVCKRLELVKAFSGLRDLGINVAVKGTGAVRWLCTLAVPAERALRLMSDRHQVNI